MKRIHIHRLAIGSVFCFLFIFITMLCGDVRIENFLAFPCLPHALTQAFVPDPEPKTLLITVSDSCLKLRTQGISRPYRVTLYLATGVAQLLALLESVMLLGRLAQDISVVKYDIKEVRILDHFTAPLSTVLCLFHRPFISEASAYFVFNFACHHSTIFLASIIFPTRRETGSSR